MSMVKKIFFLVSIFAIFFFVSAPAHAQPVDMNEEYGATCTLRKCQVPIPTLISPDKASFSGKNDIYLTGLTWNNTKIQVYLDEKYQGEAVVSKDDSGIGNFYYKLAPNTVNKGSHKWSVIAQSAYSRSFVSKENTFNVTSEIEKPVLPKNEENTIIEPTKEDVNISENTSSTASSTEIIIESASTTIEGLEIGNETTSTIDEITTSTESIIVPSDSTTTTEAIIKESATEPIEEKIEEKAENVVSIEPVNPVVPINNENIEQTSSIKEDKGGIIISNVESPREVSVYDKSEGDVRVNVAENSEGKSLVVDNNYVPSENSQNIEEKDQEVGIAEKLQNAKPGDVLLNKIKQELGFNSEIEKQKKNRIIGIAILSFVIALYVTIVIRRRGKK